MDGVEAADAVDAADGASANGTAPGPHPELVEPARAQVIALAAEVLGRLPADEVPPALRPIARFTPAKRQRLGGAALGAALDADDRFRRRVAEVVIDTSPQLVTALRAGSSTAAADPLDVAVLAYLIRPDGWPELIRAANDRWADEHGANTASRAETDALRAEVAELRARTRGESARIREAVRTAAEHADAEVLALRRTVRDRTRELRQALQDRDSARAGEAQARAALETQTAAQDAELRRQRARLADAERAAENARRGSKAEREVDEARLWLLVDTLVQAANGVRRELSLASPQLRPADAVEAVAADSAHAGRDTRGRSATDPAGLDRLLAMPNVHLVVDGYNVTKTGYGELSLADQRTRLIGALAALAAQSGAEITIAFDGGAKPPVQPPTPRGIRVLFSAAEEIADDLIRRLVAAEPAGRPVVVVTSDQQIVTDIARDGAWSVPSAVLLARLG